MFWSDDAGGTFRCPDCAGRLTSERHTYVLAVRHHGDIETFIASNEYGYFCDQCPVVVLDSDAFAESTAIASGGAGRGGFAALGIVDWDAVPDDKQDVPLGEDDNPIPLVEFVNLRDSRTGRGKAKKRSARRKRSKGRRKKRK